MLIVDSLLLMESMAWVKTSGNISSSSKRLTASRRNSSSMPSGWVGSFNRCGTMPWCSGTDSRLYGLR